MPADRVSIFRNQEKRNRPAFQEFFDQRFGCLDTTPLTKQPRLLQTTPFLTPPRSINLSTPKKTAAPIYFRFRNPYHTQTNKRSLKDDDIDVDACVLRTASAQKLCSMSHVRPFYLKDAMFSITCTWTPRPVSISLHPRIILSIY